MLFNPVRGVFLGLFGAIGFLAGAVSTAAAGNNLPPCNTNFTLTSFGLSTFIPSGSAQIVSGALLLTENQAGQAGSAWYRSGRATLATGFDTTFTFRLDGTSDGIAFVLQSSSLVELGAAGNGMGYQDIARSLAIEIDTFCFTEDFECDHVSVQTQGLAGNSADDFASLGHATLPVDVNDGLDHTLRINYLPGSLTVYFDGSSTPLLTLEVDLTNINGNSIADLDGCVFMGFTGATGGATAAQSISAWTFSNDGTKGPIGCTTSIDLPTITNPLNFSLQGSATIDQDGILLTDMNSGQAGAAWYRLAKANVRKGFETTFTFITNGAADGLAFVIQNQSLNALGAPGSGLGYAQNGPPGITNSLAVEIDTFSFGPPGEFDADHISIQTNGIDENRFEDSFSFGAATLASDVNDGQPHTVRIVYTPGMMDVYVDGAATPTISTTLDLDTIFGNSILDPSGCIFIGFTASTGGVVAEQRITSWTFDTASGGCVPPKFTEFPSGGNVNAPGPLLLSAGAIGSPTLSYRWYFNSIALEDGPNIKGSTTSTLLINSVNTSRSGTYDIVVSNDCGGTITGAIVTIVPPCPGDANSDGAVNFADVTDVLRFFGTSYGDGTGRGDANASGSVTFADITDVLRNFGDICI